jgi:Mg2+ and Co2+ transporter CorA
MQMDEITTVEKIDQIGQEINQYQKEIGNIREQVTPTTPSPVKYQRKKEEVEQLQEIKRQVSTITDLLENTTQLWKKLEEDQKD